MQEELKKIKIEKKCKSCRVLLLFRLVVYCKKTLQIFYRQGFAHILTTYSPTSLNMKSITYLFPIFLLNVQISHSTNLKPENHISPEASKVTFEFAGYPEKRIIVTLKKGTTADTLFTGQLDKKGKTTFIIPPEYTAYTGMAKLKVEEASFEFILTGAGENMYISCEEKSIHGGNVVFRNSKENECLQKWFMGQMIRMQKISLLTEMEQVYEKDNKFLPQLKKEKEGLEKEQLSLEKELKYSPLFASKFMQFHNFLNRDVAMLEYADTTYMASVRKFVVDSLDINNLYASGLWFGTINGLLAMYDKTPYQKDFIKDMSVLLRRAATDKIYNNLAENLISICEAMKWYDMEEELAYSIINEGRIKQPEGKLKMLTALYKLKKGSKAPMLTNGENPANTLLVFYESGCGSCENEMINLKSNYPLIQKKGYEVISVSADANESTFKNTALAFPWKKRLCDLKGFSGDDFKNYGVMGTPTFFVIDKEGKIEGRYNHLADTGIIKK